MNNTLATDFHNIFRFNQATLLPIKGLAFIEVDCRTKSGEDKIRIKNQSGASRSQQTSLFSVLTTKTFPHRIERQI